MASSVLRGISNLLKSEFLETVFSSEDSVTSMASSANSATTRSSATSRNRRPRNPAMFPGGSNGVSSRTASGTESLKSHTTSVSKNANMSEEPFLNETIRRQMLGQHSRVKNPRKSAHTFQTSAPVGKTSFSNTHRKDFSKIDVNGRTGKTCNRTSHKTGNSGLFKDRPAKKPLLINDERISLSKHRPNTKADIKTADTFRRARSGGGGSARKSSFVNKNQEHLLRNETNTRANSETTYTIQDSGLNGDKPAKQLSFVDEDTGILLRNRSVSYPDTITSYVFVKCDPVTGEPLQDSPLFNENLEPLLRNEMNASANVPYTHTKHPSVGGYGPAKNSRFVIEERDNLLRQASNTRPDVMTASTFAQPGVVGDVYVGKSFFSDENQYNMFRNNVGKAGNTYMSVRSSPIGSCTPPPASFLRGNQQYRPRNESTARTDAKATLKLKQGDAFGGNVFLREPCVVADHNHRCTRCKKARSHAKKPYCNERYSPTRDLPDHHLTSVDALDTRRDARAWCTPQYCCSTEGVPVMEPPRNRTYQTGHISRVDRIDVQTSHNVGLCGLAGDGLVAQNPWSPGDNCRSNKNKCVCKNAQTKNSRHIPYHAEQRRTTRRSQSFPVYQRFWQEWEERVTKEARSSHKSCTGKEDASFRSRQLMYKTQPGCYRADGGQLATGQERLFANGVLVYDNVHGLPADMWRGTADTRIDHTVCKQASSMQTRARHKTWPKGGKVCFAEEVPRANATPNGYDIIDHDPGESSDSDCSEELGAIARGKQLSTPHQSGPGDPKMKKFIATVRESPFNSRPPREEVITEPESENILFPTCASNRHSIFTPDISEQSHLYNRTVRESEQQSPDVCNPLVSNNVDQNAVRRQLSNSCHPVYPTQGDDRLDFERLSPCHPLHANRRTDETFCVGRTSQCQINGTFTREYDASMTFCSPERTERVVRTQSFPQQPSPASQVDAGRVASDRVMPVRRRQTWVKDEANLVFRHSSSPCPSMMSRSSHYSTSQPPDDDHVESRRAFSQNSRPFRPDDSADSPNTASKCQPVDEESTQHKYTRLLESPERQLQKQPAQQTQQDPTPHIPPPPPSPPPQTSEPVNEQRNAHRNDSPKKWPWDEQVVGPKRTCSAPSTFSKAAPTDDKPSTPEVKVAPTKSAAEPKRSQDVAGKSTDDVHTDELERHETIYRKHMAGEST